MTAADKRVQALLERWLASVDLHTQYLRLDDAAYARAQDWPKHQRPTRWVVELARTRLVELSAHLKAHQAAGNAGFAESLELMSFLTSLLASEHIDRFIPLATPKQTDSGNSATVERPRVRPANEKESSGVRKAAARRAGGAKPETATATARSATAPTARSATAPTARSQPPPGAAPPVAPLTADEQRLVKTVLADAMRFLEWGTEWPALASKIAHLAGRPGEAQVRNILRAHRDAIQRRARRPPD